MATEKRLLIHYDDLVMMLAKQYGATMDTHIYSPRDILSSMQGIRPADAVEVVRCKDCKWCRYSKVHDVQWCDHESGLCDAIVGNEYCSYGERRTVK